MVCQEETCEDKKQNQDETGIDCGGSVCPLCGMTNSLWLVA